MPIFDNVAKKNAPRSYTKEEVTDIFSYLETLRDADNPYDKIVYQEYTTQIKNSYCHFDITSDYENKIEDLECKISMQNDAIQELKDFITNNSEEAYTESEAENLFNELRY